MNTLTGPLLDNFITLLVTLCIRYYPLRSKLRVSVKTLIAIYIPLLAVQCGTYIFFQQVFGADYAGYQLFKLLTGIITIFIPFLIIKNSFYEQLFLLAVSSNYVTVIFGVGHYVELTFGGVFAEQYPYIIFIGVAFLLSMPLLPLLLKVLGRLFGLMPDSRVMIWKFIWIIPTLFFALCMMTANIFMGADSVTYIFVTARVVIGAGMVVTCFLFARALRQEADNAGLVANARMMENQLGLQREQYERLTENAEHEKAARHDLRHQLAVIGQLSDSGSAELKEYVEKLTGSLPVSDTAWCKNYAVNAVINHHLSAAESENIRLDIGLEIPEKTGRVPAMDLCVIMGNLLENAVEACRRMEHGGTSPASDKFIRVRSMIQGDYLTLMVENSFDGVWNEKDGVYLSRKRERNKKDAREGVGLSSVKAVCAKYGGRAVFEVNGGTWRSSAVVVMGESESEL